MITIVTTHDLLIFECFCQHKFHNILKQNMIVYVDKEDSVDFRNLIDSTIKLFDRKDLKEFYGNRFLENTYYCVRIMFINMLIQKDLINDSIYITDDDVLVYDKSFYEIMKHDKIVHINDLTLSFAKDASQTCIDLYKKWNGIGEWLKSKYMGHTHFKSGVTNCFIPKNHINKFKMLYSEYFFEFYNIILKNKDLIDVLAIKSKSNRKCDFATFFIEIPFFNTILSQFSINEVEHKSIKLVMKSDFKNNKIENSSLFWEKYLKRKLSTKNQPIFHIVVPNKLIIMKELYNILNGIKLEYKNMTEIFEKSITKKK